MRLSGSLADWRSGLWVHYSAVPKLGVNPQQTHGDPAGVYFFPAEAAHQNWADLFLINDEAAGGREYKTYARLKPGTRVLDLLSLSTSELRELVRSVEPLSSQPLPGPITKVKDAKSAWEYMRSMFPKPGDKARWNKALQTLGFQAVFDDIGAIYDESEVQLLVLDIRAITVVDRQQSSQRGGFQAVEGLTKTLAEKLRGLGQVEVTPPRRVRRLGTARDAALVESVVFVQREDNFVSLVIQLAKARRPFVVVTVDETQPARKGQTRFLFDPLTGNNEIPKLLRAVEEVLSKRSGLLQAAYALRAARRSRL